MLKSFLVIARFILAAISLGLILSVVVPGGASDVLPTKTWADSLNGGAIAFFAVIYLAAEIAWAAIASQSIPDDGDDWEVVAYGGDQRTRLVLKK